MSEQEVKATNNSNNQTSSEAVKSPQIPRKLTPKECFRLQGWTDDYFEKAAFVNSDSQLYKEAGNGVTVSVIEAMAKKMRME